MSATSPKTERRNPCKNWPECEAIYGRQNDVIPRVVPSERFVLASIPSARNPYAAPDPSPKVAPTPAVAFNGDGKLVAAAPKPKVVYTVSLYERIGKIEESLAALSNGFAKGALVRSATESADIAGLKSEVASLRLKDAAAKVAAMPKVVEPPKPPKLGDTVWLKSSGKGPFVLVGEIPLLEIDVARVGKKEVEGGTKKRFSVEGFTARWVGSGKCVALPKEDVTTVKPVFPTLIGRAVKYGFIALGMTTLLTATLFFGRAALDRAARGAEQGVAPVKTSTSH